MHEYSARWQSEERVDEGVDDEEQILDLLEAINMTIYSSGENYDRALVEFFAQLGQLGQLIGASDIDEISAFVRRNCRVA